MQVVYEWDVVKTFRGTFSWIAFGTYAHVPNFKDKAKYCFVNDKDIVAISWYTEISETKQEFNF